MVLCDPVMDREPFSDKHEEWMNILKFRGI